MRFRLRDILLLMVLLAVYLTTLNRVMQIKGGSNLLRHPWITISIFLLFSGSVLPVCNRLALERAKPIELRFVAHIPWKILVIQLLLVVFFGVTAIWLDSFTVASAFLGAWWPFVTSMAMVFLFNKLTVSTKGIVYHCYFRRWGSVRVVRDDCGAIVAIDQGYPRWIRPGTFAHRYLWPGVTLEIPPEHQQQVTELYEQAVQDA